MAEHVKTATPCCITGSRAAVVVATKDRHGDPLRTVISKPSGLVFTDPRPSPDAVRQFYSEDYRTQYKNIHIPKNKHILRAGRLAVHRVEKLRRYLSTNAKVLDAGSGGGEFVYVCKSRGFTAQGIEPNKGYAGFSRAAYGINVFNGFYQDAENKPESLDCITMFHVLEHLETPVDSLRLLARFLKPGGKFAIEVPNVDFVGTTPQQKWHIGHLYNFNPKTLIAVAAKAGLRAINVETPDNGVIFGVFEKPDGAWQPDIPALIAGSFDHTFGILSRHTAVKHYLKLHVPVGRLVAKVYRNYDERRTIRRYHINRPVQILEKLMADRAA